MRIDGIMASPAAASWINTTENARILCVFERSCTLIRDDGELLSLVTKEIGPGPFSMVVAPLQNQISSVSRSFSSIRSNCSVSVRDGVILLDWLVVDGSDAEIWNPKPNWQAVNGEVFEEMSPELMNLLKLHAPSGSMADLVNRDGLNQTQHLVNEAWYHLAKGLGQLDLSKCKSHINSISGLGSGMTPAGDDFLLGILMALWSFVPITKTKLLVADIVSGAQGRTTTLSAAWLEAAGKGEATHYWHDFIEALASGAPLALQQAGRRLIGHGHTSGADALAGFFLAGDILSKITLPEDGKSNFSINKCSGYWLKSKERLIQTK